MCEHTNSVDNLILNERGEWICPKCEGLIYCPITHDWEYKDDCDPCEQC